MAKPDKNKAKTAEEVAAEAAIFGENKPEEARADVMGVVSAPKAEAPKEEAPKASAFKSAMPASETLTISREQFSKIMERLGDLESIAISSQRNSKDNVFNPLQAVTEDRTANVVFYGDELVLGYKEIKRPDGRISYTSLLKDDKTNEVRTYSTLILRNQETKETREQLVDHVHFIEAAIPVKATIKSRKDIGQVKEHGLVNQMVWNGKAMVPTNEKVMTGAVEQKFVFSIELNNEIIDNVPENALNIK